ncbi:hypothetical protein JX265_011993 [Neoarthrinium moseri]|uniref:Uncharacterized protein n=1 Tax=Neoarthrinium moseri TaxID=1658444 RepID=A0A9P9WB24_9PEZI|nr:uncharacterized protein JN550_005885 [Neoarthrinium moseri]KAI1842865.1 hypothetical protein JX266_010883 [Neoarthrinium moseri]KAI1855910.1 hypothetical protein JX265_011993 [Neoarthrinium moseri]KAI1869255.1 hypothetical protein JN550_005885 [Neoarthrinium moseri]
MPPITRAMAKGTKANSLPDPKKSRDSKVTKPKKSKGKWRHASLKPRKGKPNPYHVEMLEEMLEETLHNTIRASPPAHHVGGLPQPAAFRRAKNPGSSPPQKHTKAKKPWFTQFEFGGSAPSAASWRDGFRGFSPPRVGRNTPQKPLPSEFDFGAPPPMPASELYGHLRFSPLLGHKKPQKSQPTEFGFSQSEYVPAPAADKEEVSGLRKEMNKIFDCAKAAMADVLTTLESQACNCGDEHISFDDLERLIRRCDKRYAGVERLARLEARQLTATALQRRHRQTHRRFVLTMRREADHQKHVNKTLCELAGRSLWVEEQLKAASAGFDEVRGSQQVMGQYLEQFAIRIADIEAYIKGHTQWGL